jgi:hypothetical protein
VATLKFAGGMSYEGISTGSRAVLWLIDSETVAIDLTSKSEEALQPDTRFLGVAKKTSSGKFITPWTYLINPEGGVHIDGSAFIDFYISHLEDEKIRIIGTWHSEDEETIYKFDSYLPRSWD